MSEDKNKWEDLKFPKVKNIQPKLLSNVIEGIPTSEMPKRMNEMIISCFENAVKLIESELSEIRGVKGKEDRVVYLEELLKKWKI